MAFFAVRYTYTDDTAGLDRVRPSHRSFLASLTDGPLVASGPLAGADQPSALLLLRAESAAEVTGALDPDPFWEAGLIAERAVEEWNPIIGIFAEN
ncbi:YciI family protein [Tessaracoccus lubricantis]|uniref:YciI family protein n=1 Tax=Tessaracoccus lubricantis TaxID=545543 RepID=A0ABP9FJW6_9ACTN